MKITFIDHSGFLVELDKAILLFDYYTGDVSGLLEEKPLYVFVSHKHQDHFNPRIFEMFEKHKEVSFILSTDARMNEKYMTRKHIPKSVWDKIYYVGKGVTAEFGDVFVETLRSTDEGVAFLVKTEGKEIYHAGDLNWWSWIGETDQYNNDMERDYKEQIDKIADRKIDVAFLPLDPRLEERASWGMEYFCEKVAVEHVIPMHMWGQFDLIDKVKEREKLKKYKDRILGVENPGQIYVI